MDNAAGRETVDPGRLRTDISLCLQLAGTRTRRDNLAREAFRFVAESIVEHFEARGYEVTAPRPKPAGPGPNLTPWQPPHLRRE
jgi:hypothetical protein